MLTINALTASDYVVMPLECEFFALRGIALLTDTISKVQDRLNPSLQTLGILGTMYDARTLHSREVLERVVQAFGDDTRQPSSAAPSSSRRSTVAGEPITTYASASPGADAYRQLAREVLLRVEQQQASAPPFPGPRSCSGPRSRPVMRPLRSSRARADDRPESTLGAAIRGEVVS